MIAARGRLADSRRERPGAGRDRPARRDGGRRSRRARSPNSSTRSRVQGRRDYFVAPAGDFEDQHLPGWQFDGGASLTAGNSAHAVIDGTDGSASRCPGQLGHQPRDVRGPQLPDVPLLRRPARSRHRHRPLRRRRLPGAGENNVREAKKFKLKAKDGWQLSDDIKLEPQRLGKRSGWRKIALRFRVEEGKKPASYRIDDVLIDPRSSTDHQARAASGRARFAPHITRSCDGPVHATFPGLPRKPRRSDQPAPRMRGRIELVSTTDTKGPQMRPFDGR